MPTNRRRKLRVSFRRIPKTFSDGYIEFLRGQDFLGDLEPDEIEIAKELGIYCWDGKVKEWRNRQQSHSN
jgi:hypothetical protein